MIYKSPNLQWGDTMSRIPIHMHDIQDTSKANERQVGGEHYKVHGTTELQHWDIVKIFKLDYFQGNITKYVMRWRNKGGVQDLQKARHYLDKYIENEGGEDSKATPNTDKKRSQDDIEGEVIELLSQLDNKHRKEVADYLVACAARESRYAEERLQAAIGGVRPGYGADAKAPTEPEALAKPYPPPHGSPGSSGSMTTATGHLQLGPGWGQEVPPGVAPSKGPPA